MRRSGLRGGDSSRRYGVPERIALLDEFEQGNETFDQFCARKWVSTATLCKWRKARRAHGEAGLVVREPKRNASGKTGRTRTADG